MGSDPNYDVVVIGAGINGAGIARAAALSGQRVLVLEQNDVASGTTSASTRLIHGGLRYLEHGELGLVRESLHEREALLELAPHLVEPLRPLEGMRHRCDARRIARFELIDHRHDARQLGRHIGHLGGCDLEPGEAAKAV